MKNVFSITTLVIAFAFIVALFGFKIGLGLIVCSSLGVVIGLAYDRHQARMDAKLAPTAENLYQQYMGKYEGDLASRINKAKALVAK